MVISPMSNKIEHFLLDFWISFLCSVCISLLTIFLLCCYFIYRNSLCILNIGPLLGICVKNIVSLSVGCLFILLILFFDEH